MRIRTKLLLLMGGTLAAAIGSMAALSYRLQKDLVEHDLYHAQAISQEQRQRAEEFATLCQVLIGSPDRAPLLGHLQRLMQETPGLAYVYVADPAGVLVLHSDSRFSGRPVADWEARKPPDAEEVSVRLDAARSRGRVVLGFERGFQSNRPWEMERALERMARRTLLLALAVTAVGLAVALAFAWRLTRPLAELSSAASRIARGEFGVRLAESGGDEIGALGRRFEEMAKGLAAIDEMKDAFISAVNHDLRGPMSAIATHAEWLLNDDPHHDALKPSQRNSLQMILDSAHRLILFVTNVLDAGKMKAGRMEYHLQAVALDRLARNAKFLFGLVASKRGLTLAVDVPADLPRAWTDPERVEHVLANLLTNALKFTPAGGRVELRARADGSRLRLDVSDTGLGIDPKDLPGLFSRYRQFGLAEQKERLIRGTGLGLYIVKETLQALGGEISAASTPGQGTRFSVWLPRAEAALPNAETGPSGGPGCPPPGTAGAEEPETPA